MHRGMPDQISLLKYVKYGSVVWPRLSQQWLMLVCTLLVQQRLQIS